MLGGKIKRSVAVPTEKKQQLEPLQKNIVKLDKISDSEIETTENITFDQLVTQLQNERVVVENNLIKCIIPAHDLGTNEYIFDTVSEQLEKKINLILILRSCFVRRAAFYNRSKSSVKM